MKKRINLILHKPEVIYIQTVRTNAETQSATPVADDSGSSAAKSSSTHETARDGTKWKFMEFGVEARGRHAAQNVVSEQSDLSPFPLEWLTPLLVLFKLYLIITCSNTFSNLEARRVFGNKEWELLLYELKAFCCVAICTRSVWRQKLSSI